MPRLLNPEEFAELSQSIPVIDVRSQGEFLKGHIVGASNLPLFDNTERSIIGTLYVQSGRDIAVKQGLEIVGQKFGKLITAAEQLVPGKEMIIHCWRGGMRSESMAWFFEKLGYKVHLLNGGYKAYRRFIRQEFLKPSKPLLIGGMTGSGKTEILNQLDSLGQQTIDLEGLAHHKGSLFGHLGQDEQPSTEQFENMLYHKWHSLRLSGHIWLEHESKQIGKLYIPDTFYETMLSGTLLRIIIPREIRVARLVNEYACFEKPALLEVMLRLKQHMGTYQCKLAMDALEKDDFEDVASIVLDYYDKTYETALQKRPVKKITEIELNSEDMKANALSLLEFAQNEPNYE